MILEIDWGNSRIKWRLRGESGTLAADAAAGDDLDAVAAQIAATFPSSLSLTAIRVASVRPEGHEARMTEWAQKQWQLAPRFARSVAYRGGVVNAYTRPELLGVDRWLGLLAARSVSTESAVVIQAGTALTADLLDSQGQHLGGYIAPGWQTMRRALSQSTARVHSEQAPPECVHLEPASDTAAAVEAALSAMVIGFVQNACAQLSEPARLIVAGGDAGVICSHFSHAIYWPDIVLDGLAVASSG